MRTRFLLVLFLAAFTSSCWAARQITVEQLESMLSVASGKSDADIARQLSEVELSERLSAANLSHLQAQAPGLKSRQALLVLADLSAFLALPPAELSTRAAPDVATQRQILARTVDYVLKTIHQLPNLSTTRVTAGFQSTPFPPQSGQSDTPSHQPLHPLGTSSAGVLYRDGGEVVQAASVQSAPASQGLTTSGEFGPILNTVLLDAARSKLAWSHWEQGAQGMQAVFHYAVPAEKSHYEVKYCCIWRQNGDRVYFQQFVGYQGDIAVDPADGSILRLTLMADLKPTDPLVKAGILVEYGPVVIAGKTYTCPIRSVALSVGLEIRDLQQGSISSLGLLQTSLNDSVFEQYHVFRSEVRVVSAKSGDAGNGTTDRPADTASPDEPAPAALRSTSPEKPALAASPDKAVASAPPISSPPAAPALPEISVGEAAAALHEPASAFSPQTALRGTVPLIDVGVIAFDKKGRPVTGLGKEDFEIYDNGRRQITQFVNQEAVQPAEEAAPPGHRSFSNTRSSARGSNAEADGHFTILLIDPANLGWADLSHAREELLRALPTLPSDERVALYITRGQAFNVLSGGTTDRALLASRLRAWLPNAADLALARQEEQHDHQTLDKAGNTSDVGNVNENGSSDLANIVSVNPALSVDSKLRDIPDAASPEAQALLALLRAARSLAMTPGRKNLVWISSEHPLADERMKTKESDSGNKQTDSLQLRAEQALNYANISLYPLDTSQLAAPAIGPGLQNESPAAARSSRETTSVNGGADLAGRASTNSGLHIQATDRILQEIAEATGGRVLHSAASLAPELQAMIADSRAMYELSFTPDTPPDDRYHRLVVKLASPRGVTLRYRSGYQYAVRPPTLKERFQEAIWQPADVDELALRATPVSSVEGSKLMLNVATADLALKLEDQRWRDKLDIFLVEHDEQGLHVTITGQTLSLALKPETFDELTLKGIPFEQVVDAKPAAGSVRVLVVDENSGLMGSVTVPANEFPAKP